MSEAGAKASATIYQILDDKGQPLVAAHTDTLWVDRSQTNVFSRPTTCNKIASFSTGLDYFADLIKVCDKAVSEIYIAGWQVNWDALLEPGLRLYDLLLRCARRGVRIYVMPWDDTEPVQTYDDQTKVVLESINQLLGKNAKGGVSVTLCSAFVKENNKYFSHHQKQVVVDREIAYVGGIDLAYGRMDDESFHLEADSMGRQMLNQYNPGIPAIRNLDPASPFLVDPDLMSGTNDKFFLVKDNNAVKQKEKIKNGGWQIRYEKAGAAGLIANTSSLSANTALYTALDPARQPRMPWQDVHCKIEGPAVSDLLRNFILRWNVISNKKLKAPKSPDQFGQPGNAHIQVLRSASARHCMKERPYGGADAWGVQQDIHMAMKSLIAKARHFIYIENQFFVSNFGQCADFGTELSPAAQYIKEGVEGISDHSLRAMRMAAAGNAEEMDRLPQNGILKAILARLRAAILHDVSKPKFHIYITLPVHPEGSVADATIAVQVYYTMQTLVFGSHSLINGIKRLIKARQLKDAKDANYLRVINDDGNTEYQDVPVEACYYYVTLLNLRNWTKLGSNYVTEQIYVHSKLMIVDDRFALLGSANINDRSLLGERDSELALLVMDDDTKRADINGKGSNQPVRLFAHELRKKIWNKLFGITSGVRPANGLKQAIDEPGHPDSWKSIQAQATQNAALYDAAFPFIPRNKDPSSLRDTQSARILPTWDPQKHRKDGGRGALVSAMPFQDDFWTYAQHAADAANLTKIQGFMTALPVEWTNGENIRIPLPTALIVNNNQRKSTGDDLRVEQESFASISRTQKEQEEQG